MTDPEARPAPDGLYLYAVTRSRSRRARDRAGDDGITRVRYRDLEAVVRPVEYAVPAMDEAGLGRHQRTVERLMRRATVLPAPFGIVFQGRRAVLRFLADQYMVLEEGLAFLDGHWEMRLHILGDEGVDRLRTEASRLYSDLRVLARAALPLPAGEGRLLSAAFLVERAEWIRFVEETDDLGQAHPELVFDVTGPWPPYDFVRIQP
jgi:hypothetical protein